MRCAFCNGRVKVVDEFLNWQTVQCMNTICGVRYNLKKQEKRYLGYPDLDMMKK